MAPQSRSETRPGAASSDSRAAVPTANEIAAARRAQTMSGMPDQLRTGDSSWQQRVRERAYAIWLLQGRPDGSDEIHWTQAERELHALVFRENEHDIAETPGDAVKAFGTES